MIHKLSRVSLISAAVFFTAFLIVISPVGPVAANAPGTSGVTGGAADPYYVFRGSGRAHGVGLCMDGVLYRAQSGQSYRDIINHYYTGITFGSVDENQPIRVKCRDGQVRTYTLHNYLYHLQEEPESYPSEGLKVLYVAARTYVLSCIARGKHAKDGYDICSSGNCCQAFDENKNLSQYPNNCRAVDATAGEVILYNGSVITAAYCGSCGGHSENNEDVWGGKAIPYLRGKPDTFCQQSSRFAWEVMFRKSEVEARLNSRADTAIGQLYVMDLSNRTPGGRVRTARLVGSSGTKTVSGGVISSLFGLQSNLFDMLRANFDEYLLVLNPNPEPALLTFTFMRPDGQVVDVAEQVGANSRYTMKVNDYMQFQEVSTRIVADRPVIAERAMYFNFRSRFIGGNASTGTVSPSPSWFFAEGYTGGEFETYVLVQNPQAVPVELKYTFMKPDGENIVQTLQAPAQSRVTLQLDSVPGLEDTDVSTLVECAGGDGIIAERSMYFDYSGRSGGHNAPGVNAASETWYLAEGYTGGEFDTYVLLQNPGDKEARIEATFMSDGGKNTVKEYTLDPHSRYTIEVDKVKGLENASFSTALESLNGVEFVAERAMYFRYGAGDIDDGHSSVAATSTQEKWYFAEGYTGDSFDTWILLQNPEEKTARVKATFNTPGGDAVVREFEIEGKTRKSLLVDHIEGLASTEVATTIESTNGVGLIAERAMYFLYTDGYRVFDGGHDTIGVNAPSSTWYFAEGYTGF
ncbi:MAG: SpoIID/LytB domain-containing protein [Actinobacteria bacterium]|nr:SpoIID/LytB domain-containing protein [Actinomycetota bacterium]